MFQYGRFRLLLGFAALVTAAGCGGQGKTVKVEGIVTLDGKALPGATVTFVPAAEVGRAASGRTDSDGTFRLTTFGTDDGALPGEYKVTVVVQEGDKESEGKDPMQMSDSDKMKFFGKMNKSDKSAPAPKKSASPVPALYGDPAKTPLKQVVPPAGKVELALRTTVR